MSQCDRTGHRCAADNLGCDEPECTYGARLRVSGTAPEREARGSAGVGGERNGRNESALSVRAEVAEPDWQSPSGRVRTLARQYAHGLHILDAREFVQAVLAYTRGHERGWKDAHPQQPHGVPTEKDSAVGRALATNNSGGSRSSPATVPSTKEEKK